MSSPDPTLLDIFAAEQAEHVSRMRSLLEGFDPSAPDAIVLEELLRRAHTLKGAARAVGFDPTELLMHSLEGAFAAIRSGERPFRAELRPVLLRSVDAAEDILAAVLAQQTMPDITGLLREVDLSMSKGPSTPAPVMTAKPEPPPENGSTLAPSADFVRVSAADLDEWMNVSSELVATTEASDVDLAEGSQRAEAALREWWRLRQDAAPAVRSLQRNPEFAPVLECIQGAERQINQLVAAIRSDAVNRQRREWDLRRLADRLDESALRVRMVTAETVFGAFGPMLRNLARDLSKEIEFRAEGLELPADRLVLQLLKDPVMHLLRNALSHGVETPEERIAAGKPPAGTIRLLLRSRGDRLRVVVEDDGRGLDRRALADEAARQGIRDALSAQGLEDLIFRPGFSTSTLTTLSGRGIGLSVVHHEVARLHGDVRVDSKPGKGTSITLFVPLSISSQSVLLVTAGGQTFGILTSFVEQLCRVNRTEIETVEGKPAVVIDSIPVVLVRLTALLALSAPAEDGSGTIQAVVLAAGGRRAAVAVDSLIEVRDAVIKPLGLAAADRGLGAGAVPLPDGGVAVILNVADLFRRLRESGSSRTPSFVIPERTEHVHRILVVDDSMTTRSLEKTLLEAHGFDVQVAVDGVEALEKLRRQPIDLVITDLMMPRMDGFQLLEQIRLDKALARTPVIVVSSMESREDQERGLALGADAYIVKRKFDQRQLLETVRQIL